MFYLTRFLVEAFTPINVSIMLIIITLLLLLSHKTRAAIACLSVAIFILLFCGYGFVVKKEIGKREQMFPALTEERLAVLQDRKIDYIVVLGSAHVSDSRLPVTGQIGGASLFRLAEGVRLLNLFSGVKLVISGGIAYDPVPNADLVKRVAESLGVRSERIITENRPRDTVQEAKYLAPLLGGKTFVLVTSALHMPRVIDIFRSFGMEPIAAPTDYIIKQHVIEPPEGNLPNIANFELSRRIIYEWIGTLWSKIKVALADSQ